MKPSIAPFAHCLIASLLMVSITGTASAQTQAPKQSRSTVGRTISFVGGAAAGLVMHEMGHVVFGAAFGASPRVAPLHYAGIPFFEITHNTVSRRQEFVISSAGFWVQYANSEWILTKRPNIRHESAPFEKGILAFDVATSTLYSAAAFARMGPDARDTRGMAVSLGTHGWPEPVVGVFVLAPAVFDGVRYLKPDAKWAKWASRVSKVTGVALTMMAGK